MAKAKVIHVEEGEWLEWGKFERWICCDCSLVHAVEHRTRNGKLEVRMFRKNRSTAAYRRGQGIKVICGNDTNRNTRGS